MKYKQIAETIKRGDILIWEGKPTTWASGAFGEKICGKCGLHKVTYPYEFTVEKIDKKDYPDFIVVVDQNGYGWSIKEDQLPRKKDFLNIQNWIDKFGPLPCEIGDLCCEHNNIEYSEIIDIRFSILFPNSLLIRLKSGSKIYYSTKNSNSIYFKKQNNEKQNINLPAAHSTEPRKSGGTAIAISSRRQLIQVGTRYSGNPTKGYISPTKFGKSSFSRGSKLRANPK